MNQYNSLAKTLKIKSLTEAHSLATTLQNISEKMAKICEKSDRKCDLHEAPLIIDEGETEHYQALQKLSQNLMEDNVPLAKTFHVGKIQGIPEKYTTPDEREALNNIISHLEC